METDRKKPASQAGKRVLMLNDLFFIRVPPTELPIATRNIPGYFRRCGRGILKGAAFRQRPLSRLLLNVLAGTRTLPPEEPAPKHFLSVGYRHGFLEELSQIT